MTYARMRSTVLIGAAAVALCACDSPAPSTVQEGVLQDESQSTVSDDVDVPAEWQILTRSELEDLHEDRMGTLAESLAVDVPDDAQLVDFVPPSEWPDRQVACLQEMGFDAESKQGGVALGTVPDDQSTSLREAMVACEFQFAIDPRISNQPLPRSASTKLYEHWVQSMDCLRSEGYTPEQPPSLEVWLGEFYSPTAEHWDPFTIVGNDAEELDAVQVNCTYMPADIYPNIPSG